MDTPQNFRSAFNGFNREDVVRYLEYVNAKNSAQLNQLTAEADALRQKLSQMEAAGSDSVSFEELESLRTKLEASESSNAALENRCADLQERVAEKAALESQVTSLQKQLAQQAAPSDLPLQQHCVELEAQISRLTAEKEALEARNAELEQKLSQRPTVIQARNAEPSMARQELEAYRRAERAERVANERADVIYQRTNGILADATARVDGTANEIGALAEQVLTGIQQLQMAVSGSKQTLQDAADVLSALHPRAEEN